MTAFSTAHAAPQGKWALCAPGPLLPARTAFETDQDPQTIDMAGDEAELDQASGISVIRGDAQLDYQSRYLEAQVVTYDESARRFVATDAVRYWESGVYLGGDRATLELDADQLFVDNAGYLLEAEHAHGDARSLTFTGSDLIEAKDAGYTTCDPDDPVWILDASSVRLDKARNEGRARNVLVRLKGVPVFWSPFVTWPLTDERKSGFLMPGAGVSKERGYEASIPYYWNIAPDMDATVTARPMSRRGGLLAGEFRYLTPATSGILNAEYMPQDLVRGEDRGLVGVQHAQQLTPRLRTDIDARAVTDKSYFQELGSDLTAASTQFLEQRGDLSYSGDRWWALLRGQRFQTVDEAITDPGKPYGRLPQLLVQTRFPERTGRLNFGLEGELVNFYRDAPPTAQRLDSELTVSYPWRTSGYFWVPSASLRYTQYHVDGLAPGAEEAPDRLIPTAALDTGLFFERDWRLGGRDFVHTLEPRLFYLYVPFDDQSDLPVFDTGRFTFGFDQLFRNNRFSGADRVGDANQLSVALTSRILAPGGGERLRASVGQAWFFRDREVTLPEQVPETETHSPIVADLAAGLGAWRARGGIQWDPSPDRIERGTLELRYQPAPGRVLNAAYRFVRLPELGLNVEQTDTSFRWPLNDFWSVVGRWNYSLTTNETLEVFGGIEYESCCWAFRAVARRFVNAAGGETTSAFFLQLQLKGLAGVGEAAAEFLGRSIPGYTPRF